MNLALVSAIALGLFAASAVSEETNANCPTIKTKRKWGGSAASSVSYEIIPVEYVIFHHTVTRKCESFEKCAAILKSIQNSHKSIKFNDIGYKPGLIDECAFTEQREIVT